MIRPRAIPCLLFISLLFALSGARSAAVPDPGEIGIDWQQSVREANRAIGEQDLRRATLALEQALQITERFPEGDVRRASTLEQLASVTQRRGYPTEALNFYERALEERRRADRLDSSSFVAPAALLERLGEYERAETLLREALARGESADLLARLARLIERVRPDDPETTALLGRRLVVAPGFDARVELASRQTTIGDHEAAARNMTAAIEEVRGDPAFPAWRRVQARMALAAEFESLRRVEEAEAELNETLAMEEDRIGAHHPQLVEMLRRLGLLLAQDGRPSEAAVVLDRAIELRERAWGACHACAQQMRDAQLAAVPRFVAANPVCVAGADPAAAGPQSVATDGLDGEVSRLRSRGEFAEARERLIQVLDDLRKSDPDPIRIADALERLARVQAASQDRRAAIESASEALQILAARSAPDSGRALTLWHLVGENALLLKEPGVAAQAFTHEIELRQQSGEILRPAGLLETLSRLELERSRPIAAAEAALSAADAWIRAAGSRAPEVARARAAAARAFVAAGSLDEAERILALARKDGSPESSTILESAEAELGAARRNVATRAGHGRGD